MTTWGPVIVTVYLLAGVAAAAWSYRHGRHRPDASTAGKVIGAVVTGLLWPGIAVDLWLVDPDDTRRQGRRR